jgi:Ca2+-binding EF-hand superfamily protein
MMIGFYDVAVAISQADVQAGRVPSFVPGPEQMARYLLQQFDKNRDGKISQREIPLQPMRLKLFFMMVDKNKNGEITLDELTKFLEEKQKQSTGRAARLANREEPKQSQSAGDKASATYGKQQAKAGAPTN